MPLGLPENGERADVRVDQALISFAAKRHRVECLLHPWPRPPTLGRLSPEAAQILQRAREQNARRSLRLESVALQMKRVGGAPSALLFKGQSLARQLYGDPLLSRSNDVDVLVDRRDFRPMAERLLGAGFAMVEKGRRIEPKAADWLYFRLSRDVTLAHVSTKTIVELHHRRLIVDRLPPFTVGQPADARSLPYALLDAAYATYLIAHGAYTNWHRLKWLADLTQVWRRLSEAQLFEVMRLCEETAIAPAARATLALAEDVFPLSTPPALLEWANAAMRREVVESLHLQYRRTLLDPAVSLRQSLFEVYRDSPYAAIGPRVETLARVASIAILRRVRRIL
jgi:hypothetical protein